MFISPRHAFGDYLPTIDKLNNLAGDYWARFYEGKADLYALSGGIQQELRQEIRNVHEIAASHNASAAPIFHHETFWPVLVDPATVQFEPIVYGEEHIYGDPSKPVFYGQTYEDAWWVPIDPSIVEFCAVCDSIVSPDVFLTSGFEARVRRTAVSNHLEVRVNPTEAFRTIIDQYGRERLLIWLYMPAFDRYLIAQRFGTIIDTFLPSTYAYRNAVAATFDSFILGSSELQLRRVLAAAVNEVVADKDEVVEYILTERPSPVVITNQRTVVGAPGKVPAVSVGQRLVVGDFFFDTVQFTDFSGGVPSWLTSLALPGRITGLKVDTVIPAGDLPLTVTTEPGDEPASRVEFQCGSEQFWDWINRPVGAFARFLAFHLGIRPDNPLAPRSDEFPDEADLLDALAHSPLRYSISVSQIKSEHLVPEATAILRLVREVVPPWVSHIIQFNGDPPVGWTNSNDCDPGLQLLPRSDRIT